MPWRGSSYDGEFPSLGWLVAEWLEEHFTVPDGALAGQPLHLSDDQVEFLVRWYQLDDRGRFVFRRGSYRGPQGCGKSPTLAFVGLAALDGPVRFDGWDAHGEPVGTKQGSPLVQVAACSEDQSGNVYSAAYEMAVTSPLNGTTLDVGKTRINRTSGIGVMEPVTAAAGTRLGQRVTDGLLDEPHLWLPRNGGKKLAATIRRNASKTGGRTIEATNAYLLGEDSVAEQTHKDAQAGAAGLLYFTREHPRVEDLDDRDALLDVLRAVYGDAVEWIDIERIADEIADPSTSDDDARRFFLNEVVTGGGCPIDLKVWDELADTGRVLKEGEHIGLGFDGSISDDRTAVLYGCTHDGFIFEIEVWENDGTEGWEVPRLQVEQTIAEVFGWYSVGRMLCDPPKWQTEIERWAQKYGDEIVLALWTNQPRRFAPVCDRFATAVSTRSCTHDGKKRLRSSLAATAKKFVRLADDPEDHRSSFVIVKADVRKIDEAVGAHLAYDAAMAMDPLPEKKTYRVL